MTAHRVVATAGHVDHGKSTLVRALTGTDPDRLEEEQRRGLTIELGFAWCDLPGSGHTVAFVDVPGHARFIETMLAGAGPAPAALLAVAADDGWSAQTEEHVEVLDLLDVPGLVVVVTKVDLVDGARRAEVRSDLAGRLRGTTFADAPVLEVDGPRGVGVDEVAAVLARGLATLPIARDARRPRLWVDRSFPVRGAGTVVTGTLGGGALAVGDEPRVLPAGTPVRVRGLHHLGTEVARAAPGTRVAVNLAGIDRATVGRGDALVAGGPWRTTDTVDVVLRVLPGRRVERAGAWRVHVGSAAVTARVLPLTDPIDGPPTWEAGTEEATGAVRLLLATPLPLVAGDRLVLREGGRRRTVAGGTVADPQPGPPPRGRPARRQRVEGLLAVAAATSPAERLRALLHLAGGARPGAEVLAAAGVAASDPPPEGVVAVGDHAVLTTARDRWGAAVVRVVREGTPGGAVPATGRGGADREALVAASVDAGAPPGLAEALPDHLVAVGLLVRTPGGVRPPGVADAADAERRERDRRFLDALTAVPFAPPPVTETAREHGLDHRDVNRLLQAGAIVRSGDLVFSAAAVARAVEVLEELEAEVGPFTAAQAKAAWATTRRSAIPLLEHLDRTRVTRFDGRLRTLTDRRPAPSAP